PADRDGRGRAGQVRRLDARAVLDGARRSRHRTGSRPTSAHQPAFRGCPSEAAVCRSLSPRKSASSSECRHRATPPAPAGIPPGPSCYSLAGNPQAEGRISTMNTSIFRSHGALRAVLAAVAALLLAAGCGGGGDDMSAPQSAPQGRAFTEGTITGFGSIIVNGIRFDESTAQVIDDDDEAHDRNE